MRWKTSDAEPDLEGLEPRSVRNAGERVRADLERRGLSPELAARLSPRVEGRASALAQDDYESLLDGVTLAAAANEDAAAEIAQHEGELQEIERLMSGFASELGKLDEVLEVMAVQLRKLRDRTPSDEDRTLH
jgi:hypothetical protein